MKLLKIIGHPFPFFLLDGLDFAFQ